MTERTKVRALVGLVLLWVIILSLRMLVEPEPQRVALQFRSGQTVAVPGTTPPPTLAQPVSTKPGVSEVPANPSKNIFAPLEFQKPKPKKKKVVKKKKRRPPPLPKKVLPPPPPGPSPEELAAQQIRAQMAQYRVLGYSSDRGRALAFLGKGRKIFIAGVGETVEGRIEIAAITDTAVKLRETRTNVEATLPYKQAGR